MHAIENVSPVNRRRLSVYDFIRKREFFQWWEAGYVDRTSRDLKSIQDAWILAQLADAGGLRICEVGGGACRALARLAERRGLLRGARNECWNVDRFEGAGNGPVEAPEIPGVRHVRANMGEFSAELADASFDVIFSISVLEHVPCDKLADCFADMARLLRPGGRMLHAIDLYVDDEPRPSAPVEAYRAAAMDPKLGLSWIEAPKIEAAVRFRSDFATNSVQELALWNESGPTLRDRRAVSQSCSIVMGLTRTGHSAKDDSPARAV